MINAWILLVILVVHWVADFILQTDEQAKGKSTSNRALTSHVCSYSAVWGLVVLLGGCIMGYPSRMIWFIPITFVCHWITDYFTSRLNTRLLRKGDTHNFFVSVGFDQILHYVQLLLTYLILY